MLLAATATACELQWRLASMVTMDTKECLNIASAIVINFEKCNVTLLQTKMLEQSHVDQETIKTRLDEIRSWSRSKQYMSSFSVVRSFAV